MVQEPHGALHVRHAHPGLHRLEHDGARDVVRLDAAGLHLLDELPGRVDVLPDRRVEQLVVGDLSASWKLPGHLFMVSSLNDGN